MTALVILLVLTQVAPGPCDDVEESTAALEAAARQGNDAVDAELARLSRAVGFVLVHPSEPLEDGDAKAGRAATRLEALCSARAARAAEEVAPVRADADRGHLRAILDRPEFEHARQRRRDPFEAIREWFRQMLDRLFGSSEAQSFAGGTRLLVLGVAIALLLALTIRVIRSRRGHDRRSPSIPDSSRPLALSDPQTHLDRARTALPHLPREAIREALLALLSTLERRRWARPDRVKTNRELSAELPTRGAPEEASSEVRRLTEWYDRTFYSLADIPPDEATRFVDDVSRFAAGEAPPPGTP